MKFRLSIACAFTVILAGCSSDLASTTKAPSSTTAAAPRPSRTRRVPVPTVAETQVAETPAAEDGPAAGTTGPSGASGTTGPSGTSASAPRPTSTAGNPVTPRVTPRRNPVTVNPAPVRTRRPIEGHPRFTAEVTDAEAASVASALETMIDISSIDNPSGVVRTAMMQSCPGIAGNGRGCAAEVLLCLQQVSSAAEAAASSYYGQVVGTLRAYGESTGEGPDAYSAEGMDYRMSGWSAAVASAHGEILDNCNDNPDEVDSACTAALRALSSYMGAASRAVWARHARQSVVSQAALPASLRFSAR